MVEEKEFARRKKISSSLINYFKTDKGISHKNKLKASQAKRMAEYGKFLHENNIIKIEVNEKQIKR